MDQRDSDAQIAEQTLVMDEQRVAGTMIVGVDWYAESKALICGRGSSFEKAWAGSAGNAIGRSEWR